MNDGAPVLFGVGATKAGTSWLHDYLSGHPDCHFRAVKELHYFDMAGPAAQARQIARLTIDVEVLSAQLAAASGPRADRLRLRVQDTQAWLAVVQARSDAAYLAYMTAGAEGRLVGDVTPSYAMMPEPALRHMVGLTATSKVVYLMRDPVARLWSHVRMMAARSPKGDFAATARGVMAQVLAAGEGGHDLLRRGDYRAALPRLMAVVPAARLLVMFMEDLMSAPGVARLCGFLGLRPHSPDLDRRVHEGTPLAMDADQRAGALRLLRPQYDAVTALFPALPDAWLRNRNEALA
ncbi:MAG: sulfotransferase [Pseudomonadota bacterium]